MSSCAVRVSCRKGGSHGTSPETFFANIWSMDGKCHQLGHGTGATRAAAIAAAKLDAATRAK